jgi:hypothetical protein
MIGIMGFEIRKIQDSGAKWEEARPLLRGMGIILLALGAFFLVNGLYTGAQKYRRIGQCYQTLARGRITPGEIWADCRC